MQNGGELQRHLAIDTSAPAVFLGTVSAAPKPRSQPKELFFLGGDFFFWEGTENLSLAARSVADATLLQAVGGGAAVWRRVIGRARRRPL